MTTEPSNSVLLEKLCGNHKATQIELKSIKDNLKDVKNCVADNTKAIATNTDNINTNKGIQTAYNFFIISIGGSALGVIGYLIILFSGK